MTEGVDKLKELLFDSESRAIADLEYRLNAVFSRSGTDERFQNSVAKTLDGALRDAEVERHEQLSDAIAPLIVRTIKTEITNSQDELAEALYPMTGRMVKSYVASAIKDLTNQVNRSLERNPLMLRLNSMLSGRSVAELALADAQAATVEELYLIRRGSGELVARWPKDAASANRDQVMSGILTAINEFALEAFSSQGTALRQIDLGESQVYLRGSPGYLLAAKCSGTANAAIEQTIDAEFLNAIEAHHELAQPVDNGAAAQEAVLADLATRLTERIDAYYEQISHGASATNPVKTLLFLIGMALVAWLAWTTFDAYQTRKVHAKASHALANATEMVGYPVRFAISPFGSDVTIDGLAPSPKVKQALLDDIKAMLPTTPVRDQLTIVNSNFPDHRPELSQLHGEVQAVDTKLTYVGRSVQSVNERLDREALTRATTRAISRLRASLPELSRLSENLENAATRTRVNEARQSITAIVSEIETNHSAATNPRTTTANLANLQTSLLDLTTRIDRAAAHIAPVLLADAPTARANEPHSPESAPAPAEAASSAVTPDATISHVAEELALKAEHFATLAAAASQASAMRAPPPPPPVEPTPRERLEAWTRANAIFFKTGTDFANPERARQKLNELARLASEAKTLVRVVGFTDEKGQVDSNSTLSMNRANRVRSVLLSEGLRSEMVVAVGRRNTRELSPAVGETSPNRRVEFELGFIDERPQ